LKNEKINPIFFQNNFEDSNYALIFASRFEKRGEVLRKAHHNFLRFLNKN